jgi:hypothetical protein
MRHGSWRRCGRAKRRGEKPVPSPRGGETGLSRHRVAPSDRVRSVGRYRGTDRDTQQPPVLSVTHLHVAQPVRPCSLEDLSERHPRSEGRSTYPPPGMFGLLGRNGAGKSTLMRIMATLQEPDAGMIHLGELDVVRQKERGPRNARVSSAVVRISPARACGTVAGALCGAQGIYEIAPRQAFNLRVSTAEQLRPARCRSSKAGCSPYRRSSGTGWPRSEKKKAFDPTPRPHELKRLVIETERSPDEVPEK